MKGGDIQHDPLMQLILGETDAYTDAEERRLLYVALTHARRRAIIVANDPPDSVFTRELSGSVVNARRIGDGGGRMATRSHRARPSFSSRGKAPLRASVPLEVKGQDG